MCFSILGRGTGKSENFSYFICYLLLVKTAPFFFMPNKKLLVSFVVVALQLDMPWKN